MKNMGNFFKPYFLEKKSWNNLVDSPYKKRRNITVYWFYVVPSKFGNKKGGGVVLARPEGSLKAEKPYGPSRRFQKGPCVIFFGHLLEWLMNVIIKRSSRGKFHVPPNHQVLLWICFFTHRNCQMRFQCEGTWTPRHNYSWFLLVWVTQMFHPAAQSLVFIAVSREHNQESSLEHIWWNHTC